MSIAIDPAKFECMLRENGIPPRPLVIEQVSKELHSGTPDLRRLENTISKDVAIAGGLIRMANSAYFGRNRRVRSVMEAMEMMGLRTVSQAVACISLRNAFPNLQLDRFWDASAKIAGIAAWLVHFCRCKTASSEDAYTYGLFRDCGIAIILQRIPAYVDVLRKANSEARRSFTDVEEEVLPVGHAQVGAMMTQTWWLPEEITEAIRNHHDVIALSQAGRHINLDAGTCELMAVVQFAEYLFQQATQLSLTREWEKLGVACLTLLSIDPANLPDIQNAATSMLAEQQAA